MPRFLLAWEFGGDLGHVRRQAAIARSLRAHGHQVLLAQTDLARSAVDSPDGVEWVPAPRLPLPAVADPAPLNASDILLQLGFGDARAVAGALAGWAGLFRCWKPDVVAADHAPGALIAANVLGMRRATVGSGFSAFPAGEPMPALREWIATDPEALAQCDARLLAAVRAACARMTRTEPPQRARELFGADVHIVCAWPELDPFGPREGIDAVGPQAAADALPRVEWRTTKSARIFAYLKPRDPRFRAILEAIGGTGQDAIVAAPGLDASGAAQLSTDAMRVLPHAVDLDAVLPEADLCAGHAGAGLVAAACAHGVPLALWPSQLEQYLVSRRAQSLGMAAVLAPDEAVPDLTAWLREVLERSDLRIAAESAPARIARPPIDAAERLEALAAR